MVLDVCHFWREIALNSPLLWSSFTVSTSTRLDTVETVLHRSMHAPLNITVRCSPEVYNEAVQRVLDHFPRIHTLDFGCASRRAPFVYTLGRVAPVLRFLSYTVTALRASDQPVKGTPFDNVDLPSLSSLELYGLNNPWPSPLLKPTLTRLSLKFESYDWNDDPLTQPSITMSEVLRVLQSMPLLEHLDLRDVIPTEATNQRVTAPGGVPLLHLRTLRLATLVSSAASLLLHIDYPQSTLLRIDCSDDDATAIKCLSPVLEAKASATGAGPAPQLCFICSEGQDIRAWAVYPASDAADAIIPHPFPSSSSLSSPLLMITTTLLGTAYGSLLPYISDVLPVENVTVLHMKTCEWDAHVGRSLRPVWERMVNVRTLGIRQEERLFKVSQAVRNALRTLCRMYTGDRHTADNAAANDKARPVPLVFPALEELLLQSVWMCRGPNFEADEGAPLLGLPRMLAARKTAGCPLKRLMVVECINIGEKDIAALNGLAGDVSWDEQENWEASEDKSMPGIMSDDDGASDEALDGMSGSIKYEHEDAYSDHDYGGEY